MKVDVIVLTRDAGPIEPRVAQAIAAQRGVEVAMHRVVGTPRPSDRTRWDTIARARNVGRTLGDSPWVVFVDDDVVLGSNAIQQLLTELHDRPNLAAIGADYLRQTKDDLPGIAPHVSMGATLFRRNAFTQAAFRAEENKCECQCIADDLRKLSLNIDYSRKATAKHLKERSAREHSGCDEGQPSPPLVDASISPKNTGRRTELEVMVAFDRSHMGPFLGRFLKSLRQSGNSNKVHAVTYGLRPKDVRRICRFDNVVCHQRPFTTQAVCRQRMFGFLSVLNGICPETPVAYWDAGDVVFQRSLAPLQASIEKDPAKLLVTEEPLPWPKNSTHKRWIQQIRDPAARSVAAALVAGMPIINGGFMAGKAGVLKTHFLQASSWSNGRLRGAGGGDQVILNVSRYVDPASYLVTDDTWNYCLIGRSGRHCKVRKGKYYDLRKDRMIAAVHGNGSSFPAN